MFEWFTRSYPDPLGVALLILLQVTSYLAYAWLVRRGADSGSRLPAVVAGLVPLSAVLTLSVHWLHAHGFDDAMAWAWLSSATLHVSYPVLAVVALWGEASNREWLFYGGLALSTYAFLVFMIVVPDTGP